SVPAELESWRMVVEGETAYLASHADRGKTSAILSALATRYESMDVDAIRAELNAFYLSLGDQLVSQNLLSPTQGQALIESIDDISLLEKEEVLAWLKSLAQELAGP